MEKKQLTTSSSFTELFHEDGHVKQEGQEDENYQLTIDDDAATDVSMARTGAAVVPGVSTNKPTDKEEDVNMDATNATDEKTVNTSLPKVQVDTERPSSSYCKTRNEYDSSANDNGHGISSGLAHLNLTPMKMPDSAMNITAHDDEDEEEEGVTDTVESTNPNAMTESETNTNMHATDDDGEEGNQILEVNEDGSVNDNINDTGSTCTPPPLSEPRTPPPHKEITSSYQTPIQSESSIFATSITSMNETNMVQYSPHQQLTKARSHTSLFLPDGSTPPNPAPQAAFYPALGSVNFPTARGGSHNALQSFAASPPKLQLEKSPLLFTSVPLDALHSIAGFLSAKEWLNVGLVSKDALIACREVMNKVRMHGFKCAVEVVSSWEIGEHCDAKELAALYIQNGVPIYPAPFGHTYHTVDWRMKIEAKEINKNNAANNDNTKSPEDDTIPTENTTLPSQPLQKQVDRFYADQINSRADPNESPSNLASPDPPLTYLENKGLFWRNIHYTARGIVTENTLSTTPRHLRSREHAMNMNPNRPPPGGDFELFTFFDEEEDGDINFNPPMIDQGIMGFGVNDMMDHHAAQARDDRVPPFGPGRFPGGLPELHDREVYMVQNNSNDESTNERERINSASTQTASMTSHASKDGLSVHKGLRFPAKCHGHLHHRHCQRQGAVNDEKGKMVNGELSMSADFFYPKQIDDLHNNNLEHEVVSKMDLKVYSYETDVQYENLKRVPKANENCSFESLNDIVQYYESHLLSHLDRSDYYAFNESMLDFWDEFFAVTATVHFHDRYTPVPRMSYKHRFLNRPCPKAFGTVQCEIERIKVQSKNRGANMTGRLFPTYEYRLFIRDRRRVPQFDVPLEREEVHPRVDTVLMTAKHKSRNYSGPSSGNTSSGKKGVNNYHFYMPQQEDIDDHLSVVNESLGLRNPQEGYRQQEIPGSNNELGRLQSNFIGTEFQIFCPCDDPNVSIQDKVEERKSMDPQIVPSTEKTKKRSISLLRRSRSMRRQSHDNDAIHGNRKGRISPWSSFSKKNLSRDVVPEGERSQVNEIGAITYTANLLGNRPRVMDICIPQINEETGLSVQFAASGENNEEISILNNLKSLSHLQNSSNDDEGDPISAKLDSLRLMSLQNRPPWWNVELGAFVLNFGGRVSVASVKNFQLCDRNNHENIMLQFGRIDGRHSFTMDFSYPLSPLQAFAISVSSLQSKISFA